MRLCGAKQAAMMNKTYNMAGLSKKAESCVEEKLGYIFKNKELLALALTHTSWANEHGRENYHNQRLEFLGDAVLELCISDELYRRYPQAREGRMTEMRSNLVSEPFLADLARKLGLDHTIRLGKGEDRQFGRSKDSVLSDAFEAVLAAIYEDGGLKAAREIVAKIYKDLWPCAEREPKARDPKSSLQEICQKIYKSAPVYALLGTSGPEHAKIFEVKLTLPNGKEFVANESSCKKAEQSAAAKAIAAMKSGSQAN